jgi:integrase
MRHHVYTFTVQKIFREIRKSAGLPIYATLHSLRHAYATHYLENVLSEMPQIPNIGAFVRDLLRVKMGHVSAETTDIYIHLSMPKNKIVDRSPLSDL